MIVNHRPTTSMYYRDPDGNRVELQIDNFPTAKEGQDSSPAATERRTSSGRFARAGSPLFPVP